MKKGTPHFKSENLLYMREENKGCVTLLSKFHPELRELVINKTTKEIIDLCDGQNTIEDIISKMKAKYPMVQSAIITNDVHKILASTSRLMLIQWEHENPYLFLREEIIDDTYGLRIGVEDDLLKIKKFIMDSDILTNGNDVSSSHFYYKNVYVNTYEYDEVLLRQKIFNFNEEFFFLTKNGEIEGLLSFQLPIPPSKAAVLKMCICAKEYFRELFRYASDNLPHISVSQLSKIKFIISSKEPVDDSLVELLISEGFGDEGLFRDELGFDHDISVMGLSYDPVLIDEIEKNRKAATAIGGLAQ
ncbi:MAG: PqqD family peptide modification chaperone [Spirochaetales bacterium]|nr:PqqD family peptide modification chaperone [Spirochaetales bacterium]